MVVSKNIGHNGQIASFIEIFSNLPLFVKYLAIYLLFKTWPDHMVVVHDQITSKTF